MNPSGHQAPPGPPTGAGLKVLVIVMALMIAGGIAVLGVTIIRRASDADFGASADYATGSVLLPEHARIVAVTGEGDVITLLLETAGGRRSLVTLDRRTGAVLGTLALETGAP
jgi:hypothetical protein